jgi:hypothetical protein
MLPASALPASLIGILEIFRCCFTAPTFATFTAMVAGLISRPRRRTVCGMLVGAGLERVWPHDRAHSFFARRVWSVEHVGLALIGLVVTTLLGVDDPIEVAVDDTLFQRTGRRVFGAFWQHNGSAKGPRKIGYGNCFVVVSVRVRLAFLDRSVGVPVLAGLHRKDGPTKVEMAARFVALVASVFPGRAVHGVGDAAYHSKALRALPATVSWTCRLPRNAVLHQTAPPATGKRGRPRLKGDRLGIPADLAERADTFAGWAEHTLRLYDEVKTVRITEVSCLWYTPFHTQTVRVILVRNPATVSGYDLALVTTDLASPAERILIRYGDRWTIEQVFLEVRHILGAGEARNRVQAAVERTVPFELIVYSMVIVWYALHGHPEADVAQHRAHAPWYTAKHQPSFEDMLITLRRTIIATRYTPTRPTQPTDHEIRAVQLAWEAAAA